MTQTKPIVSIENVVASASVDQQIDLSDVTKYFKEHMEADVRHTASWRKIIEQESEQYYLINVIIDAAERSIICQNILLDSGYEEYC